MVATFLQVHHDVEEGDGLGTTSVQLLKITSQNPSIVLPEKIFNKHLSLTTFNRT